MESPHFTSSTPAETLEHFAELILQQAVEDIKDDESWEMQVLKADLCTQVPELRMVSKCITGSGIRAVKVSGIIKTPPQSLFNFFYSMTDKTKQEYDTNLIDCTTVREVTKEIKVQRLRYSAPFPIYPREFVVLRVDKQINGSYYLFSSSISYDACPATTQFVRGVMRVSGLIMQPNENGTLLTKIVQIDPRGSIPAFVVNLVGYKQAEFYVTLNSLFSEKRRRKCTL